MKIVCALLVALTLCACGKRGELEPPTGYPPSPELEDPETAPNGRNG